MAAKVSRPLGWCPTGTVPRCQVTCGSPPPNASRYSPTMIIRPTEAENR